MGDTAICTVYESRSVPVARTRRVSVSSFRFGVAAPLGAGVKNGDQAAAAAEQFVSGNVRVPTASLLCFPPRRSVALGRPAVASSRHAILQNYFLCFLLPSRTGKIFVFACFKVFFIFFYFLNGSEACRACRTCCFSFSFFCCCQF